MIRNRVYLGEVAYGRDRRYINPDAHDRIVDLALWTAAQHPNGRLAEPRSATSAWLLAGIARCSGLRLLDAGDDDQSGKAHLPLHADTCTSPTSASRSTCSPSASRRFARDSFASVSRVEPCSARSATCRSASSGVSRLGESRRLTVAALTPDPGRDLPTRVAQGRRPPDLLHELGLPLPDLVGQGPHPLQGGQQAVSHVSR